MAIDITREDTRWRDFIAGVRTAMPIAVAVLPFGVLFGALAVDNGFSVFEAALMSGIVFGGASQMVGIELFGQHIAPWVIVLSIFAVNFRHVLYSASFGRRMGDWRFAEKAIGFFLLTDPQFAEAERRAERGRPVTFAWYIGMGAPIWVFWVAEAALGAYFGRFVQDPKTFGLDFLLPIYFLGLVMSFRKRPRWLPIVVASAVASMLAVKFVGSPWHVTLGALAGIVVAVIMPPRAIARAEILEAGKMEEGDL